MGGMITSALFFVSGMSLGLIMGLVMGGMLRSAAKADTETDQLITKPLTNHTLEPRLKSQDERLKTT